jgi:4-amino-4-deoxy-L-arabinose transferase-like glycosyltransferase
MSTSPVIPPGTAPVAPRLTWALVALHFLLLALTLADYRVTIDPGYHTSLARLYAEHLTAFWDPINSGPAGRPNLQGPAMHVAIGALGRVLGGTGDAYVLSNSILSLAQWLAAALAVLFFARRLGGDRAALFAVALFTGTGPSSLSFSVGLPSG